MNDVVVRIPSALRAFTDDASEVRAASGTVAEVLQQLALRHPQLTHRVLSPDGQLRPFVNVFVGRTNSRSLQGLSTPVPPGTVVSILPAVAGG
jgi:molybdopterin converting factor small subunit